METLLTAPILELQQVRRLYGTSEKGVHELSFQLRHGERVALLGLNGAGKSTVFRLIAGLLIPDAGEVRIENHSLRLQRSRALKKLGYLPENAPLPLELTPQQYLTLECQMRGVLPQIHLEKLMAACELGDVRHSPIGVLSRGYRKRVALAGSCVHGPELLLLDEPTAGLDPHQVEQFRRLILQVSENCAVLVSTHVLAEVEMICDRCLILHHGRLKDDLSLPCSSQGLYRVQYQGQLKNSPNLPYQDCGDGWKESCLSGIKKPEAWLSENIQAGGVIRHWAPLTRRLEDIFLEKIQREVEL